MLIIGVSCRQRESESVRAQQNTAVESMQQIAHLIDKAALVSDLRQIDIPAVQPAAQGNFGEMEQIIWEAMAENVAMLRRYLQTMEAIGWMSILDAERLDADVDMAQSRAMLDRARAAVDTAEESMNKFDRDMEQRIRQANMSEKFREDLLKSYLAHEEMPMWTLERQAVDEIGRMIDLLSKREIWTLNNGTITFYDKSDRETYNDSIEMIKEFGRQQQQMRQHQFNVIDDSLESMKR
ncbi:MAG: hypothetical protein LBB51_06950 [Zoogloeaceae bacterium]|nr:hypothetical protein [Zoogloeaceae bacterium]